ncbi:MAG: hypothetical protein WCJ60_00215 [bacterium]
MTKKVKKLSQKNQIWFNAKKAGWGWCSPKLWQGWAVLLVCFIVGLAPLVYVCAIYDGDLYCKSVINKGVVINCNPNGMFSLYIAASMMWFAALIFAFAIVLNIKGEKPFWRWPNKKGDNDAKKS